MPGRPNFGKPQPGVRTQYVWYPPGIQNRPYHTSSKNGCGVSLRALMPADSPCGDPLREQAQRKRPCCFCKDLRGAHVGGAALATSAGLSRTYCKWQSLSAQMVTIYLITIPMVWSGNDLAIPNVVRRLPGKHENLANEILSITRAGENK